MKKFILKLVLFFLNNVNNRAIYYFDLFFNLTQITIKYIELVDLLKTKF